MKVLINNEGLLSILSPDGAFIEEDLGELAKTISQCLDEGQTRVLMDLTRVSHFDSKGLEKIEEWTMGFNRMRGGWLAVVNPNPLCRDILRATRMDHIIEVFDSMEEALQRAY